MRNDPKNHTNSTPYLRQGYIWNTAAGLISAMEAVVMSMIVTRVTGLADAGILSIAFTLGNQMILIGKFGLRDFQTTDIEGKFSFSVYWKCRIVTVLAMLLCTAGYLGYAKAALGYSREKSFVILPICLIYAVEAVEDVIWGYYQQLDRLDRGAQLFCVRWVGILLAFPLGLWAGMSLTGALMLCFGTSVILFVVSMWLTYPQICLDADRRISFTIRWADWKKIGALLWTAAPLCGVSALQFYVNNSSKYAIDACLTDEIQACFGFVAMPMSTIRLLSSFIYQPLLVPMAAQWERGEIPEFLGGIRKQLYIIAGLSAACLAGAWVMGIPVLSFLYGTDLAGYKAELMILLLSGGFMAGVGYQTVVLTVMRCRKELLWPYAVTALIAAAVMKPVVAQSGTLGASVCYLLLMVLMFTIYLVIISRKLKSKSL